MPIMATPSTSAPLDTSKDTATPTSEETTTTTTTTPPAGQITVLAAEKKNDENEKKADTLAEAKDRAQLTATTAMSIINVALLKDLLDNGSEGNKYYTVVLWLVILSLAFQVIVGALAMMVSHMRSYYSKTGDDSMCDDVMNNICCLRCKQKKPAHDDSESQHGCKCCCNFYLTSYLHPHHHYKVMDQYEEWESQSTDDELRAAEANVQLEYITAAKKEASEKRQQLEEQKEKAMITETEYTAKVEAINSHLASTTANKEKLVDAEKELRISRDRGVILVSKVAAIRREHMLKTISFWQNIINYLLYFVFIFNAFITGLGIVGGTSTTAPAAAAVVDAVTTAA